MAWTAPRTWILGELVTAPLMNTHIRDNLLELRAGGVALASQTPGDLITAASGTQLGRVAAATLGQFLVAQGANLPPAYSADFTTTTIARRTINETFANNLTFTWPGGSLITNNLGFSANSAAAPGLFINADTNTGIYSEGADRLDFTTAGVRRVSIFSSGGTTIGGSLDPGAGNLSVLNNVAAATFSGSGALTSLTVSGASDAGGAFRLTGVISPTLAAANNNWIPTGLSTANIIRASGTAGGSSVTGIASQAAGTLIGIVNISSNPVILWNEDPASTAINRIQHGNFSSDLALNLHDGVWLWYDGVSNRWRVISRF